MNDLNDMFDWRSILIDQYKELGMDEYELAIILVIHSQKNKGIELITPDILSLNMTMSFKNVDKYFSKLIKKNLVSFENKNSKMSVSIEPLKKKLFKKYYEKLNKEKTEHQEEYTSQINDILILFENEFGRALTKSEVVTIEGWLKKKYKPELIKEALNVSVLAKAKTIRYIDKVLLEWRKKEEISNEGRTSISKNWNKDLSETLEIAGINWLDDDDE